MKRFVAIAIAVAVAMVAAGPASGRTERQQDLAITALKTKLSCLVRYPVTEFGDYAWFGLIGSTGQYPAPANPQPDLTFFDPNNAATYPFAPTGMALNNWGRTTGLDFSFWRRPTAWMLGLRPTTACRRKFSKAADPNARATLREVKLRNLIH